MRIDFPLLSILSVGFLLFFALQGGDVTLHSIEVGIVTTPDGVRITIDPAFIVWTDVPLFHNTEGETFGNVSALQRQIRYSPDAEYVRNYEVNHIKQYYGLGWMIYPFSLFGDIESPREVIANFNDPTQPNRTMWLPPDSWINQWSFISFSVGAQ